VRLMAAAHGDCAAEGRVERGGLLCVAGRRRSLRRAFGSIGRVDAMGVVGDGARWGCNVTA